MNSFYTYDELKALGIKSYGENVLISRRCSIYSPQLLTIGNNVRIDDFCILSGNISIGDFVHISAFCALHGSNGIDIRSHSGCSARTTIYSAIDDFSGNFLIGPMHPDFLTNVQGGKVIIEEFAQVGANCVIFPNLTIGEGAAIGALSLVRESIKPWTINAGIPARVLKERSKKCKKLVSMLPNALN